MNGLFAKLWHSRHRRVVATSGATLGVVLLLAVGALGWSIARLHTAAGELDLEQQGLASVEQVELELAALQAELPQREARLRTLQAGGFLKPAERVAWAEAVAAGAAAVQPLRYSAAIAAPQWLTLPDSLSEQFAAQGFEPPALQATDLVLRVEGLHEDELARLIEAALSAGGGVTRLEHCRLARRTDNVGLDADCTLRRFALAPPPSAADGALPDPTS